MRIAMLVLGLFLAPGEALAEAAVAVGRSPNGGWAYAYSTNYSSEDEAAKSALARCNDGAYDCNIEIQFRKTCVGLSRSSNGGMLSRSGDTKVSAERAALRACRKELTGRCQISDVVCDTVSEAEIAAEKQRRNDAYQRFTWHWSGCLDKGRIHACSEALTYSDLSSNDRERLTEQRALLQARTAPATAPNSAIVDAALTTGALATATAAPTAETFNIAAEWNALTDQARAVIMVAGTAALILLLLFVATLRQTSAVAAGGASVPILRPPPIPNQAAPYQTAAAIAALELAHSYIREFHDDHGDAITDPLKAREILETLALVAKQIDIAERNGPLARITIMNKDGSPLVIDLTFLKSHALYYESLCHWAERPRRAIRCLEQALALAPNSANALYTLGLVHHSQLNKRAAIAAFEQAVALDPGNLDYRKALERAQNISGASIALDRTFAAGRSTVNAARWMFALLLLGLLVGSLIYYPMGVLGVVALGIGSVIHNWATRTS